jgi:hypothetical protein
MVAFIALTGHLLDFRVIGTVSVVLLITALSTKAVGWWLLAYPQNKRENISLLLQKVL